MKTDRELLELAAKACGLRSMGRYDFQFGLEVSKPHNAPYQWNPLTDDGDALRLAVKLKLLVDVCDDHTGICNEKVDPLEQAHGKDDYAATRLAIVRAAAAIGGSSPWQLNNAR